MPDPRTTVERRDGTAVVRVRGDVVIPTARGFYAALRTAARRRDVRAVVVDFSAAGRLDSSGVAALSLGSRLAARAGKAFDVRELSDHHKAAIAMLPPDPDGVEPLERAGFFERVGDRVLAAVTSVTGFVQLIGETIKQSATVIARRKRLPAGAVTDHIVRMGTDAVFIVGMLCFLLGTSLAFQTAMQLRKLGAGVYIADLVGVAFVREFGPILTAIILSGRTGAAIAAELGTMKVRSEVDALSVMGVNPVRFLVVPRIAALTLVQPALSLFGMAVGVTGAMVVASITLDLSPEAFWTRVFQRVELHDFVHGLGKSLVFAWVIGFVGVGMGLSTRGDAQSVGQATTRAVVVSIFLIILVDAVFAVSAVYWGDP
jgi:phospholipid/cholesterol/gamma-HCH transport system permease protein